MHITVLDIYNFRNIRHAKINLHPRFNVLVGENGAGKTAVLEAIYFLGLGRSFRANQINRIIQYGMQQFVLFMKMVMTNESVKVGLQRGTSGEGKLKLNNEIMSSHVQITQQLPILLFNPESFQLFTRGAKLRRQLIDWGIFYQDSDFLKYWQRYMRALKQRNAALKQGMDAQQIQLWNTVLIDTAHHHIDPCRCDYVAQLETALQSIIGTFIQQHEIRLQYYRGWPKAQSLDKMWLDGLSLDRQQGFTLYGPHRADLRLSAWGKPVQEVLSRGQQKVLVCGLKLAQGIVLQQQTGRQCIYLLDDITSELDMTNRRLLLDYLRQLNAQVMLTAIDAEVSQYFKTDEHSIWSVQQGLITNNQEIVNQ